MIKNGNRYTDEELIKILHDFERINGRPPMAKDFKETIPNRSTFLNRFKSWNNALKIAGMEKVKRHNELSKEYLIECLLSYYEKYNKVPTTRDMINEGYPNTRTYIKYFGGFKNALIEVGLFDKRIDNNKRIFDRRPYSDEELLLKLKDYILKSNEIPTVEKLKTIKDMPSVSTYDRRFGGLNNAMKIIGIDPIHICEIKTEEQMISDLIKLANELGKLPNSRDISKCGYTASDGAYINRFGSLYIAYEIAGLEFNKRTRYYSDEEIIKMWYDIKNNLNKFPSTVDLANDANNIDSAIYWRWGNYSEFLKHIGEFDNYNTLYARMYVTSKGTVCYSYYEYRITNWLEENHIKFRKEIPYNSVINGDDTLRRFDWHIFHNNKDYYIEMFGINTDDYKQKTKKKIKDCELAEIELVSIFPEDMKTKSLDEIFSFLHT